MRFYFLKMITTVENHKNTKKLIKINFVFRNNYLNKQTTCQNLQLQSCETKTQPVFKTG